MKKLLFIISTILLVGCVDKNVIQVNRNQDGYRSELIATINREDADDMDFYFCELDAYCVTRWYENRKTSDKKIIDLKTKKVDDYEEPNQNNEVVWYENEEYKIILRRENRMNDDMTQSITYEKYYYEKDGKRRLLVETFDTFDTQAYGNVQTGKHPIYNEYVFMIKEEDKISIKKIEEGQLVEIDSFPLVNQGNILYDYYRTSDGLIYRYDNDKEIHLIQQNEEKIYKKELEDGSILTDVYEGSLGFTLRYESEDSIHLIAINNKDELIIPKKIDDYHLKGFQLDKHNIYTYESNKGIRIVIDDETYDLGNASNYHRSENVILFTRRNVDLNVYQTFFIDLTNNQQYILSEEIEMSDIYYFGNCYIVRGYGNDDLYSVLKIDGLTCEMIELPFDWEFKPYSMFKNQIIFVHETKEFVSFYAVEVQ